MRIQLLLDPITRAKGRRHVVSGLRLHHVQAATFWDNLKRLQDMTDAGTLVQRSAFMTRDMKGALAAVDLVKHYRGDALLFKGQRVPT